MLAFLLIGFTIVTLAHLAPFPFVLDLAGPARSVWHMPSPDSGNALVYLTFDDGPNPSATPELLDVLAREHVRATFFVIDRYITDNTAPIIERMFADGHDVALHSHTRALLLMNSDQLASTLTAAADRIEHIAGRRPCRAFRPHAGWRGGEMLEGLDRLDYALVGWSWRMWDWNWFRPRTAQSVEGLAARASAGDIIVIHDGHHKNPHADRRYAVDGVERLIPALRARGFGFATICDILQSRRQTADGRQETADAARLTP
jgi:peptidoglycan/xylan/chitin deacetylase (PgdA/CDA1 family)